MNLPDIEVVSAKVHEAWMQSKRAQGVTTRKAEDSEELMVPYEQLSEKAKDLDRSTVKAVYAAIEQITEQATTEWVNNTVGQNADEHPWPAVRRAQAVNDKFAQTLGYANYEEYDKARDTAAGR